MGIFSEMPSNTTPFQRALKSGEGMTSLAKGPGVIEQIPTLTAPGLQNQKDATQQKGTTGPLSYGTYMRSDCSINQAEQRLALILNLQLRIDQQYVFQAGRTTVLRELPFSHSSSSFAKSVKA